MRLNLDPPELLIPVPQNQLKEFDTRTHSEAPGESTRARFLEAKRLAAAGQADAAFAAVTEYLASEPDQIAAWALKSMVAPTVEDKFDAFSEMLRLDPAHPYATYGRDLLTDVVIDAVETPALPADTPAPKLATLTISPAIDEYLSRDEDFSIHETEAATFASPRLSNK